MFETALRPDIYRTQWKKGNVIPVHKMDSKYVFKNYIKKILVYPTSVDKNNGTNDMTQ